MPEPNEPQGGERPPRAPGLRAFLADNAVVAGAQVLGKLRGIITLPLIVKTIGAGGYGIWAQILAFVGFGAVLFGWSLHLPLVRSVAADRATGARTYATSWIATLALGLLGVALLLPFSERLGLAMLGEPGIGGHVSAGVLLMVLYNLRALNFAVYRALRRFLLLASVELTSSLFELGGLFALLLAGQGLERALWFMVFYNAAFVVGTSLHALRLLGVARPAWDTLRFAIGYALPLLPGGLSVWALDRADRFFIGHHYGAASVGAYSAAYALGSLVLHFQFPLQMTLVPKVAEVWDRDPDQARRYIALSNKAFLMLAIPYAMALPVVAPVALRALGSEEIAEESQLLTLLIAVGTTLWGAGIMQTHVLHGARQTGPIGVATVAGVSLNLVLNMILVPTLGPPGAALATVASYLLTYLLLARSSRRIMKFPLYFKFVAISIVVSAVLTGSGVLLVPSSAWWMAAWCMIYAAIYVATIYAFALEADERAFFRRVASTLGKRS